MASITIPMVIVFCLAAFALVVLLYLCMRRMRQPPESAQRDARYEEMYLPGEPRDHRHIISYMLVNSANTVNPDFDYPKQDLDVDRTEALEEHRKRNREAGLTARGYAQAAQVRDGLYDKYLKRVVCAYASNTKRSIQTATELLKIGSKYGKAERKAKRCPTLINPVDDMSQYGVLQEIDGKITPSRVSKQLTSIEDALANIGTTDCDLAALYAQHVSDRPVRSLMKTYVKPSLFFINNDLLTESKGTLQQLKDPGEEEDIVLIVGQSPYINALAVYIADIMGHGQKKKAALENENLGDLDGFFISRKTAEVLDFDDQGSEIDALMSSVQGMPF